jgi:hypothetical protein
MNKIIVSFVGIIGFFFGSIQAPQLSHEEKRILSFFSLEDVPDGLGSTNKTVRVTGANFQIVNGLGATNGFPANPGETDDSLTNVNGVGNLIVGYNELGLGDHLFGSHNIVLGMKNTTNSFGNFVGGTDNTVFDPYAIIMGGSSNSTFARNAVCVGGSDNEVVNPFGVAVGGSQNDVFGTHSVIVGGAENNSEGDHSVCVGGEENRSNGISSVVTGGRLNISIGDRSVVSGGLQRTANGQNDWVAGELFQNN